MKKLTQIKSGVPVITDPVAYVITNKIVESKIAEWRRNSFITCASGLRRCLDAILLPRRTLTASQVLRGTETMPV